MQRQPLGPFYLPRLPFSGISNNRGPKSSSSSISLRPILIVISLNLAMILEIWILCYFYIHIYDAFRNGEYFNKFNLVALAIGMTLRFWQFVLYGNMIESALVPLPDILFAGFIIAAFKMHVWIAEIFAPKVKTY